MIISEETRKISRKQFKTAFPSRLLLHSMGDISPIEHLWLNKFTKQIATEFLLEVHKTH